MGILPLKGLFTISSIVFMAFHRLIWRFYFWFVFHCLRIFIYGGISLLDFTYDFRKYDLRLNNAHSNGPNSIQLSIFPSYGFKIRLYNMGHITVLFFQYTDIYFSQNELKLFSVRIKMWVCSHHILTNALFCIEVFKSIRNVVGLRKSPMPNSFFRIFHKYGIFHLYVGIF